MLKINIINKSENPMPKYQTEGSSAVDLYANIESPIILNKNDINLIPTGIYLEIPLGYEAQIRSRSGLALKHGVFCLNSPGTIDSDYRGEICVILAMFGEVPFTINKGERIAQLVFSSVLRVTFNPVDKLSATHRGEGGFGSTGF